MKNVEIKKELYQNKEWLIQQYIHNDLFCWEIAKKCNCHLGTISSWLIRLGIKRRKGGNKKIRGEKHPRWKAVVSEETRKKISNLAKGRRITPETKIKMSLAKRGEKHPRWKAVVSEETRKKIANLARGRKHTLESRIKMSLLAKRGEKHPNWKGGKMLLNKKLRSGIEYKIWRESVLERDKNKCQKCGDDIRLHVHHVLLLDLYPNLRHIINNGITLCQDCHYREHGLRKGKNENKEYNSYYNFLLSARLRQLQEEYNLLSG